MLSRSVVSDSVTPWTVACQAPLSMEFSRQGYWSGLPYPPPGDLPNLGMEPRSPALQVDSLTSEPPGKPKKHICCCSVTKLCLTLFDSMDCSTPAYLSFTISWSLLKLMSIELVMPSNHLVLCCPLLLLPSIFPSTGVFSNESPLCIRWPKY